MAALVGGEKPRSSRVPPHALAESHLHQRRLARRRPVTQFHGPFDPEISPDGSKIAFEYFNDAYDAAGCDELTVPPCYAYTQSRASALRLDRLHRCRRVRRLLAGLDRPALDVQRPPAAAPHPARTSMTTRYRRRLQTNDHWFSTRTGARGSWRTSSSRATCRRWSESPASTTRSCASLAPRCRPSARRLGPHAVHEPSERPGGQWMWLASSSSTTLAPSGKAMAYGTAAGVSVAAIRRVNPAARCADLPRRQASGLGPGRRPAGVRLPGEPGASPATTTPGPAARSSSWRSPPHPPQVTVTVPGTGKVTVTAERKQRTVAKPPRRPRPRGR